MNHPFNTRVCTTRSTPGHMHHDQHPGICTMTNTRVCTTRTTPGYAPPVQHPGMAGYIHHLGMAGYIHHLGIVGIYPTLGIPPYHHGAHRHRVTVTAGSVCREKEPWAQKEGIPWVERLSDIKVDKCVRFGRRLRAELLRSPERKNGKIG